MKRSLSIDLLNLFGRRGQYNLLNPMMFLWSLLFFEYQYYSHCFLLMCMDMSGLRLAHLGACLYHLGGEKKHLWFYV